MIIIILLMMLISLVVSQLQLYIDSVNGKNPRDCQDYTISSCKDSAPCQTLSCALEYANATLQRDQNQDLEIILIASSNPLQNNYNLGILGQYSQFWLDFTGFFTIKGNLALQPTPQACSKFPVLSLQNYMTENLYIKGANGIKFQYINIEIVLANQPIAIYDSDFTMENVCIDMNKTKTINFLPHYEKYEELEEGDNVIGNTEFYYTNSPYSGPRYKMLLLQANGEFSFDKNYNFSNIMITYNSTEFQYCGPRDDYLIDLLRCSKYYLSGLITYNSYTTLALPNVNFENIIINCIQKPYIKFFYSNQSYIHTINGLTTNCIPAFDLTSNLIKIQNINLDYTLFNNNNNEMIQSGVLFDILTHGSIYIQNISITNFHIGVCYDLGLCHNSKSNLPNSMIIINDENEYIDYEYRLLDQGINKNEYYYNNNLSLNNKSFKEKLYNHNDITKIMNDNDNDIIYNTRIIQQDNISDLIIPLISFPDLNSYSNITRKADTVLNLDYTSNIINKYNKWVNLTNSINPKVTILFNNITISNNSIEQNNDDDIDNFFSFIYVYLITLYSTTTGYIFENIIYSYNKAIETYQNYALVLFDGVKYYINNVQFIQNNNSRFIMLGNPVRQKIYDNQYVNLIISDVNISANYYNLTIILPQVNFPDLIDANIGIIDINGNNKRVLVALSNITINDNTLIFTKTINIMNNLISYQYLNSSTYISNIKIMNNNFISSSFLATTGSNVYITNITFNDNIIQNYSPFDMSNQDYQFNSFILQNSTFYNNTLIQSYLIRKDLNLNNALTIVQNGTFTMKLPFWITIANCIFDILNLMNNSAAIEFTSIPFVFIYNNTFMNINISQSSTLIQGSNFIDSLINIPGIANQIPSYIEIDYEEESEEKVILDSFTSKIFQSSIQLLKTNNIYSDLNLTNPDGKPLTDVFVTRIAYNTFNQIFTNIGFALEFQISQANFMIISIDHNVINNMSLSNYLDNFVKFDSITLLGLAYNNFVNMSGFGYITQISTYSNAKIYNNFMNNNNGPSFIRINSNDPMQTIINNNIIYNIQNYYTFITIDIQYNSGLISFNNNIFYNIYLKAYANTFESFNLIYVQITISNFTTFTLQFNNNSFINIQFIKNHPLIKQFSNSLLFLSNPDSLLDFQSNLFYNISILYDDNLLTIITERCHFYNNTLILISNYDDTGSLYFLGQFINITQCNFQYNFAINGNGGAIYIDYDKIDNPITNVLLISNIFRNNYALIGSSFYYSGATIIFNAQDNHFYKGDITIFDKEYGITNLSPVHGSIAFNQANINKNLIINSTILYTVDNKNQYVFLAFIDLTTNQNASIQISTLTIIANNDSFTAIQVINCPQVQIILKNISINLEVINLLPIEFLSADSGNIIISNFNMSLLGGYGPVIELLCNSQNNNSLSIINSSISNFLVPVLSSSFGIIHISSGGSSHSCFQTLNIINTTIKKVGIDLIADWTQDFASIYVDYPGNTNISISQSNFQDINSIRGPAINLNNWPILPNSNISINNSSTSQYNIQNYTKNTLQTVIHNTYYSYNVYIIINDCKFNNNSAYLEGGAIYNTYNNLFITNTNFSNNQAQYRTGAAIFSLDTNSLIMILNSSSNNRFLSNKRYSQKYYGIYSDNASLGSPPISMNLTIIKTSNSYANIINFTSNNSFLITNISTHDLGLLTLIVGLYDFLGQIFYESPNGDIELNPTLTNRRMIEIFTNTSSSLSIDCDFVNCYISNTSLILKGMAGSILPINFIYQSNENILPILTINAILRDCVVGEINSSHIQGGDSIESICTLCLINSYSLNLNDSICTECSFGNTAQCLGGAYISINPGYWRKNNLSNVIYECLNPFACRGGFNSECTYGYIGPLCQSCNTSANFARSSANECETCPGKTQQILIAFGYMILIIVYQMYMIRSTLLENLAFYENKMTSGAEKAKTQGQYVRLLTTYTQIISIVMTFQLDYPSFLQKSVGPVSSPPTNSIFSSTICFLIELGYDSQNINFYKIELISAIPFIKIIIISFIIFIILNTCKRQIDPTFKKAAYIVTIFCIILVDQPALFNNLVNFLTCIQIGNEGPYYLLSDYGIQCYTPSYNYYLLLIVLPGILIWGFLIPAILFIIMFRYRKNLSNKFLRLNLGGIFNEYTNKAYYWGIVLMLTKLLLMLSTALLYNDTKTVAMTVFIILFIYLMADGYIRPIIKLEIDRAELMATSSYLITIFFALYYKNNRYIVCQIFAVVVLTSVNCFVIGFLIYKIIMLNIKSIPCLKKYGISRNQTKKIQKNENIEENMDKKIDENKNLKSDIKYNVENCGQILSPISLELDCEIDTQIPNRDSKEIIKSA